MIFDLECIKKSIRELCTYRRVVCIKAVAYVQLFNFLVRLLFKCGLYLRAAYMQCSESAKPVKAAWHDGVYSESET